MPSLVHGENGRHSPIWRVLTGVGGLTAALIVGAGLMSLMGSSPVEGYSELLAGMVGSKHSISESLLKAAPLLIIALGVSIAFDASVWNIGADGQFYMGALASVWLALVLRDLPWYLVVPLAIAAALVAGGIWGGIAGYLRARLGINEIIVTIMANYVALWLVNFMVRYPLRETGRKGVGFPQTDQIPELFHLPSIMPETRLHVGIVGALLLAGLVYLLLRHTTIGYRLRATGRNPLGALYAGVRPGQMIVWAMVMSGGLAGLAGFVEVFGVHYRLLDGISAGYGFTAIIVCLLGGGNPLGIVAASVLFASLDVGASSMQRGIGIPRSLVSTIEYLMVLLVVGAGALERRRTAFLGSSTRKGDR